MWSSLWCTKKKKIKLVLPITVAKLIAPLFELYYNFKKQTPLFTKYSLYTLSSNANLVIKKQSNIYILKIEI